MDRESFSNVASDVTTLKSEKGIHVNYTRKDVSVSVSTTTTFTDPKFNGLFHLAPGTLEINSPVKEGPVDVKLCPDLTRFGATLAVYPLQDGLFEFGLKKTCPSGSSGEVKYITSDQSLTITLRPRKVVGPATLSGEVVARSFRTIPSIRGCAEIKDVTFRCFLNPSKKQLRAAAFYNLPQYRCSFGLATCFQAPAAPSEVFLLAKGSVNENIIASIITTVVKDDKVSPEVELRVRYSGIVEECEYALGMSTHVKSDKSVALVQGLKAQFENGLKLAYTVNNEGRLVTRVGLPQCKAIGATATIAATFDKLGLAKEALVPKVGVSICLGE